jgi:glycosyltransferase involved in cell wall biosynthesis
VATAVGGVPEVVEDGASGLVVPPADAGALAAAVRRVLGDAVLAERLGRGGRRRAAAFEWAVVTDRYEEVYRRAAAPSADRPGPAPGSQDLAGGGAAA